ncbi:MAG: RNA ligase family protein [Gemmataceae bacterium]
MLAIVKYPRTSHLAGSRRQLGDEGLDAVPFRAIQGRHVVVEEKLDGANAGLRFDAAGRLHLQSRGHFLTGGPREKHFNLFKTWATTLAADLFGRLADRFVLYGEWLYAKHTVYYDALPHYFFEFDLYDLHADAFLSTPRRRERLAGLPVVPVPVLYEGTATSLDDLTALVRPSLYKTSVWRHSLERTARERGIDPAQAAKETDPADEMEGLYLKVEEGGETVERYKFVRPGFCNAILDSGTHWLRRPVLPNGLAAGVDLFAGVPS